MGNVATDFEFSKAITTFCTEMCDIKALIIKLKFFLKHRVDSSKLRFSQMSYKLEVSFMLNYLIIRMNH